jgi:hypothetical protein
MEVKSTEQWRPGKVDITKLKQRFFPYLKATGLDPPPQNELFLSVVDTGPRPTTKSADRWARRLDRRKALKTVRAGTDRAKIRQKKARPTMRTLSITLLLNVSSTTEPI